MKKDLFGNGNVGVNFFFVLSGFLITYLLIHEKKLIGQIDLKKFWIRRILRIWPVFYLCVFFGFYGFPFLKSAFGQTPNETASIVHYLTFTNNFDLISNGLPDASVLSVLWSVAVEEQFYLFWPLVLFILPVRKYWVAFVSVIITSTFFNSFNDTYEMREYHTISCMGDMAVGALGAWLISESNSFRDQVTKLPGYFIAMIYLLMAAVFFFRDEMRIFYPLRISERLIADVLVIFIILEQEFSNQSLFKMSRFKVIGKLGIISYGLYCYHFIGILITTTLTELLSLNTSLWQVMFLETGLALGITILISAISYRFIETPFLKLKDRFEYIHK